MSTSPLAPGLVTLLLASLCPGCDRAQTDSPAEVRERPATGSNVIVGVEVGGQFAPLGVIDQRMLRWSPGESPELHGADGHCTAGVDDTAAVQAFLDAVRDGGQGSWNGCYNVRPGSLRLSPSPQAPLVTGGGFKTFAAPQISGRATFVAAGMGSGAMLTIANPPQNSGNGSLYAGGSMVDLVFRDTGAETGTRRDGLTIQGVLGWSFGQILGQSLSGSAVTISYATVRGDPDAYDAAANQFRAIVCNTCGNVALDAGSLGEAGNEIGLLAAYGRGAREVSGANGPLLDAGQNTRVQLLSAEYTRGWGIVFGNARDHGNRQRVTGIELDAVERGIWVGALLQSTISGRVIYDQIPGLGATWPTVALKLGGMNAQVRDVNVDLVLRIDPGTNPSHPGLIDLSNDPNLIDDRINLTVLDSSSANLVPASAPESWLDNLVTGLNPRAKLKIRVNGRLIYDSEDGPGDRKSVV